MGHRNKTIVILSSVICAGCAVVLGLMSDGVHHDDDLTHFMFARWSWWYPGYLVHLWGRPGFTAPMALVAGWFDRETAWHLARGLSTCVTLGSALLAADLARRMGLRYWPWVVVLCYAQPLNMVLSYTTLTENFTGLYLIASLDLLHRRRVVFASAVFSLALVTRLETLVLLPVWAGAVWWAGLHGASSRRTCVAAGMMALWAPIAQNIGHYAFFGTWPVRAFLHPSGSTEYLATEPLAFLPPLLLAATPIVVLLAIFGAPRVVRHGNWGVAAMAGAYLLTHWLIKWFGIFASGGFARFVVAVAPLLAVMAAAGAQRVVAPKRGPADGSKWIGLVAILLLAVAFIAMQIEHRAGRLPIHVGALDRLNSAYVTFGVIATIVAAVLTRRSMRWRHLNRVGPAIVLIVSVVQIAMMVRPLNLNPEHVAARDVSRFIDEAYPDAPVFAANPWIAWWRGQVEDPRAHKGVRLLSSMPAGTIFVWDSIYSESDFHQLALDRVRGNPAYQGVHSKSVGEHGPTFHVFLKTAETPIEDGLVVYPAPMTLGRGETLGVYYGQE